MGKNNVVVRDSDSKTLRLDKQEAEESEINARAKRVIVVNSSGEIIKATTIPENRLGSECSGSEGATGRVLTLQNTSETGGPVAVWVETQLVAIADYTVNHLASNSTITFNNIGIFDADGILVNYQI